MAKQSLNTLKGWAVRGWKPLAAQVKDWFDSYWHKDEPIPIDAVNGLSEVLNDLSNGGNNLGALYPLNADGYYDIPQGFLLEMIIPLLGADSAGFSIGSTDNGGEYLPSLPREAIDDSPIVLTLYARSAPRRLYFNGVTLNSSFLILIRKIS